MAAGFDMAVRPDDLGFWDSREAEEGPDQSELEIFSQVYGQKDSELPIRNFDLDMTDSEFTAPDLDFAPADPSTVLFAHLRKLTIKGTDMTKMKFTKESLPELRELTLQGDTDDWETFHLDLPKLTHLCIEHAYLATSVANANAFADSICRCPKLKIVRCYKFGPLLGSNILVLPECISFEWARVENTNFLDILHAPKLQRLSVCASYELADLHVRDFAAATTQDAARLNARYVELLNAKELDKFQPEVEKWAATQAGPAPSACMPPLTIDHTNMILPKAVKQELRKNPRVQLVDESVQLFGSLIDGGEGSDDGDEDDDEDQMMENLEEQMRVAAARAFGVDPSQMRLG